MKWGRWIAVLFLLGVQQVAAQAIDAEWRLKLSQSDTEDLRFRMSQVAMPDGTKLSVAVWTPEGEGQKFPAIMVATPYNKLRDSNIEDAKFFVPRGYAYV